MVDLKLKIGSAFPLFNNFQHQKVYMTALLRIYDDVTSNKYVSLGITASATAFSLYRTYQNVIFQPVAFAVTACAGCVLAILANTYLVHNAKVKSDGERNNIYSTCSLFVGFCPITSTTFYSNVNAYAYKIFSSFGIHPSSCNYINGFSVGFTATNLVLQFMEKPIGNKA